LGPAWAGQRVLAGAPQEWTALSPDSQLVFVSGASVKFSKEALSIQPSANAIR